MSEPFIKPVPGYAERRVKNALTRTWERAPEVTTKEQCDLKNKDPRATYEYRWVEK